MSWYSALVRLAVTATPVVYQYGFWVGPEGETVPVSKFNHYGKAVELGFKNSDKAMQAGWFRVHTDIGDRGGEADEARDGAECGCENRFRGPTPKQLEVLLQLYRDHGCDEVYAYVPGTMKKVKAKYLSNFLPTQPPPEPEPSTGLKPQTRDKLVPKVERPTPVVPPPAPAPAPAPAGNRPLTREELRQRARGKVNPLFNKK